MNRVMRAPTKWMAGGQRDIAKTTCKGWHGDSSNGDSAGDGDQPHIVDLEAAAPEPAPALALADVAEVDIHDTGIPQRWIADAWSDDTDKARRAHQQLARMCLDSCRRLNTMFGGTAGPDPRPAIADGEVAAVERDADVIEEEGDAPGCEIMQVGVPGADPLDDMPDPLDQPISTVTAIVAAVGLAFEKTACHQLSIRNPSAQTQDNYRIAVHFLQEKDHASSFTVEAARMGVSRKEASSFLHTAAAGGALLHRKDVLLALKQVTGDVIRGGGEAICLFGELRYDETPMRVRLVDRERTPAAAGGEQLGILYPSLLAIPTCSVTRKSKILQTVRKVAALHMLGSGDHMMVRMEVPTWLQVISGGTAGHYVRATAATRRDIPAELSGKIKKVQRLACTDGDAAVERAERVLDHRDAGNECLRLKCEIHRSYIWHTTVFDHIVAPVQKVRHLTLTLHGGDAMHTFREELMFVLAESLIYIPDERPRVRDVTQHMNSSTSSPPAQASATK